MSVNVQKDANFKQDIIHHNNQNTESQDQRAIGESIMDILCFIPACKQIHTCQGVRTKCDRQSLVSRSMYVHIHNGNSPIVRTEYAELHDIDLLSQRSLYSVIKVGTQTRHEYSVTARYEVQGRTAHAGDPETQQKVKAMNNKKVFFPDKTATPNLTVKMLKRMYMEMDHGGHAEMTAEFKRLGCPKKTIDYRIAKVIQECIACLHKGPNFIKGKIQKNESLFNTDVLVQHRRVTNDRYYTHYFGWSASTLVLPQLSM